jgi:hypothetical protein
LTTASASCDLFLSRTVHGTASSWTELNWGSSGEQCATGLTLWGTGLSNVPVPAASGLSAQNITLHLHILERHGDRVNLKSVSPDGGLKSPVSGSMSSILRTGFYPYTPYRMDRRMSGTVSTSLGGGVISPYGPHRNA